MNLLGHLYGVGDKFSFGAHVGVADVTLIAILFLSSGILLEQADRGLMAVITSAGPGGKAARLLFPAAFMVPAVIGWVRWKAEFTYGLFGTSVGLTLFATANILVFTLLVWANSALLNRSEAGREKCATRRLTTC